MAKPRNRTVDLLVYVVLRALASLLQALPLRVLYGGAALVADAIFAFDRKHRKRAMGHLRRSYPHWDDEQIKRTAHASMRSLTYLGVEFLLTTSKITLNTWR